MTTKSGPESSSEHEAATAEELAGGGRIVGIGASAGGLEAVGDLLRPLPRGLDMSFVVVMHLDPTHASSMAELLGRDCKLPVSQVRDGVELAPGHVYVIPPNTSMTLHERTLRLAPRADSREPQRPIDVFLRSLAQGHDGRSIGVILSGTGSDGTSGLIAIKAQGGVTFVQDESAAHGDMPLSAIAAGCVDAVLPPAGIARELVRINEHPTRWLAVETSDGTESDEKSLDRLVKKLSHVSGVDFCNYKQTTVRRRIHRRMVLLRFERLEDYLSFIDGHPEEAKRLCQDILIHVTSFFRDPDVFEAISKVVFPALVTDRAPDETIRIWAPGCATGEEVYSLAIILLEFLAERSATIPIKLFGTDVSEAAIARARAGRYSHTIASHVSPERLRQFFVRDGNDYVITKAVRDRCIFARQDATRDPPFSNLDLISCRNLLIYLGSVLQRRVLPMFHYALRDGGYLVLGTAETVGTMDDLFSAVGERQSVYVRRSVPRRLTFDLTSRSARLHASEEDSGTTRGTASEADAQREADRAVLARYAPAGVLVDEGLKILEFRGDTGAFLAPAPGRPNNDLLRMAREGLLPDLRAVIDAAKESDAPARREGLRIRADSREVHANVELIPIRIPQTGERCYVILFEEIPNPVGASAPPRPAPATEGGDAQRVGELERELVATRDYLRANVERLEVANEELRAANEEILSGNEELQSTNEELQTAKEELQATNEELQTVNEELHHRNDELARLGDDVTNLLTSVQLPIVMMGRDLRVRSFTPNAVKVLGLSAADVGKSILDLRLTLTVPDLEALLLDVLDTFTVVEREVQTHAGCWYSLSVRPYRTQDSKVDGVVITLADIDILKRTMERLAGARDYAESIVMAVRDALLVLGPDLSVQTGNRAYYETFRTTSAVIERHPLSEVADWATPELLDMIAGVRDGGVPFSGHLLQCEIQGRGKRSLRLGARAIQGSGDRERLVLLVAEDSTDLEHERAEKERLLQELMETRRLESLGVLAGGIAHDFNNILTAILGFAELIELGTPRDSQTFPYVEKIEESALRAADLCDQMLAYAGKGRFIVGPVDLSALVRRAAPLLADMVSPGTSLRYELSDSLASVEADAAQLHRVLTNLVMNASEAFGERRGTISIATGLIPADPGDPPDGPPAERVYLEVADDGPGMSSETQAHIFDPFFTTKFAGRGLGLAAVLGIVRGHQGTLELNSRLDRGSTFRLALPASPRIAEALPSQAVATRVEWRGRGTILVVDDENQVREVLQRMLQLLGFRVEEARRGAEGVDKLRALGDQIDLVLLDLTMPDMGGVEVFGVMRQLRPDLAIILVSGYEEEEAIRGFPSPGLSGFLRKPFSLNELVARLRAALPGEAEA